MRFSLVFIVTIFMTTFSGLEAAVYFVDYSAGNDAAAGTSVQAAFKHSPGDPQADGKAAKVVLKPGDQVHFKGGVVYRGSIIISSSGASGNPIVFDGNKHGRWGVGKAIIDGSNELRGWNTCESQEAANGNPHWKKIKYCSLPNNSDAGFSWNISQGNQLGFISEQMNSDDPYIMKNKNYKSIPAKQATRTSIVDKDLSLLDGADLNSAYVGVYCKPNWIYFAEVQSYDSSSTKLTFKQHSKIRSYYKNVTYNVMNCLRVIDRPGEYCVDHKAKRVYFMPYTGVEEVPVSISKRKLGFELQGVQHVTVQGFKIQKFACGFGEKDGSALKASSGSSHLKILDNEMTMNRSMVKQGVLRMNKVTHSLIAGNHVHRNPFYRVIILDDYNDSEVRGNVLDTNSGTGFVCFRTKNTKIIGNVIRNHTAVHSQGMAVYVKCSNVQIESNLVEDGLAVTVQDSKDISIHNNVFNAKGRSTVIGLWNGGVATAKITNNTMLGAPSSGWQTGLSIFTNNSSKGTYYEIKNNILEGVGGRLPGGTVNNNQFLSAKSFSTYDKQSNVFINERKSLFKDFDAGDFRIASSSTIGAQCGEDHALFLKFESNREDGSKKKLSKKSGSKIFAKPKLGRSKAPTLDYATIKKSLDEYLNGSGPALRFHYSVFKREVEIRGKKDQKRYELYVPTLGTIMTVDIFKNMKHKDASALARCLSLEL